MKNILKNNFYYTFKHLLNIWSLNTKSHRLANDHELLFYPYIIGSQTTSSKDQIKKNWCKERSKIEMEGTIPFVSGIYQQTWTIGISIGAKFYKQYQGRETVPLASGIHRRTLIVAISIDVIHSE